MSVNKNQISNQLQHRGQYAQIPNEIYQVKDLSVYARDIWCYLASEGPGWSGSNNSIASNLGISPSTVKRSIKELRDFNMIIATGHDSGTDYELISSDKWTVTWKEYYQRQLDKAAQTSKNQTPVPLKHGGQVRENYAPGSVRTGIQKEIKLPNTIQEEEVGFSVVSKEEEFRSSLELIPIDWKKKYLGTLTNIRTFMSLPLSIQIAIFKSPTPKVLLAKEGIQSPTS